MAYSWKSECHAMLPHEILNKSIPTKYILAFLFQLSKASVHVGTQVKDYHIVLLSWAFYNLNKLTWSLICYYMYKNLTLNFRLTILKKNSIDWLHYLRTTGNGLLHRIHIRIVHPAHQCARVQVQVLHTHMSTTLPQAGYVHNYQKILFDVTTFQIWFCFY